MVIAGRCSDGEDKDSGVGDLFIYPVVWLTVGTPLLILQPASSTPRGSQLSVV